MESIRKELSQNESTFENQILIEIIIYEIMVILTLKNDLITKIIENS
jgi:hypothetical protein